MRTPQQKIGDRLEQKALYDARQFFTKAALTTASGSTFSDGDIKGLPGIFVECKNSDKPGKGRSISKADWKKIKAQAAKLCHIPCHLGFDDDGMVVALLPWEDLVALMALGNREEDDNYIER